MIATAGTGSCLAADLPLAFRTKDKRHFPPLLLPPPYKRAALSPIRAGAALGAPACPSFCLVSSSSCNWMIFACAASSFSCLDMTKAREQQRRGQNTDILEPHHFPSLTWNAGTARWQAYRESRRPRPTASALLQKGYDSACPARDDPMS